MPVTKTAKRALRVSKRKTTINKILVSKLEIAVRMAQKSKKLADVSKAFSIADRAVKNKFLHKNKAARMKSALSKLLVGKSSTSKATAPKKAKTKNKK